MNSSFSFSQAIEGFVLASQARHLSPNTLNDYLDTFRKFGDFLAADPPIDGISARVVESFLAIQTVSKKTILNYHTGLSALWTWAVKEGLAPVHVVRMVERVHPEKRSIRPYSLEDVKAMLAVLGMTRAYTRPGKRETAHSRRMRTATGRSSCCCWIRGSGRRSCARRGSTIWTCVTAG